jgi:hypothetical protein
MNDGSHLLKRRTGVIARPSGGALRMDRNLQPSLLYFRFRPRTLFTRALAASLRHDRGRSECGVKLRH